MKESRKLLDAWLPPPGSGSPVSVLAISYTFEPDFFEEECLARFLSLQGKLGEEDRQADLSYWLDSEERLALAKATVLVDRSAFDGVRNLRCDLLPVSPPGGLLHAKVSLLVWEKLVRVLIGSANLAPAGYRLQLEASVCFDAAAGSEVPRSVFDTNEGANLPARALVESMAQRGEREISFLVPVDESAGKTVLHAPRSLRTEIPANVGLSFHPIVTPEGEESQRLHAEIQIGVPNQHSGAALKRRRSRPRMCGTLGFKRGNSRQEGTNDHAYLLRR